jgi:hypothetical protein
VQPPSTPPAGCTLADLAKAKGLPLDWLQAQGLRDFDYHGTPAVRIPYPDKDGNEVGVQYRVGLTGEARFKRRARDKARPYGLSRPELKDATAAVLLEGESDTLTLWYHRIPCLGLPGATSARAEAAQALAHVPVVYVVIEADKGGDSLLAWLPTSSLRDRARVVTLPTKDVSDLYVQDPDHFPARWDAAVVAAIPLSDTLALEAAKRKRAAWAKCAELARDPNILGRALQTMADLGLVGEKRAGQLIYLAGTSRRLDRPVSVVVKAQSSAGKNFTVGTALKLFPPSTYYALTAMSERALVYSDEPLVHRMLVLYEAAGMKGETFQYLLRSLLSEGQVAYETVEKTDERHVARKIVKPGPTGLILTTTALRLDPELETRLLSVPVTDTKEQTKAVIAAIARGKAPATDLTPWHALQEWLELADQKVDIPFAPWLAELISPCAVRLRRDFTLVLNLIQANAILHQATRARDEWGRIVAVLDDYAVVRELVVDIVSDGAQATVPVTVRETVNAVAKLKPGETGVTGRAVAEHLKLDKGTASRRLQHAAQLGHIRNAEERRGKAARWVLDEPMPEEKQILPLREELEGSEPPKVAHGNGEAPRTGISGADGARSELEVMMDFLEDGQP